MATNAQKRFQEQRRRAQLQDRLQARADGLVRRGTATVTVTGNLAKGYQATCVVAGGRVSASFTVMAEDYADLPLTAVEEAPPELLWRQAA